MSYSDTLAKARETLPGCIFAGCFDIEMGMTLATDASPDYPPDAIEALSAATINLFESTHIVRIEAEFRAATDTLGLQDPYFQDVLIVNNDLAHAFLRLNDTPHVVLCLAARRAGDPADYLREARDFRDRLAHGMGWD